MRYKVTKYSKKMKQEVEKIVKGFDWNRVSWYDKEYLGAMVNDTINSMSYKQSGISFEKTYPEADDFALFNDEQAKDSYKEEFYDAAEAASHLLTPHPRGRKYWLVWGYDGSNN